MPSDGPAFIDDTIKRRLRDGRRNIHRKQSNLRKPLYIAFGFKKESRKST